MSANNDEWREAIIQKLENEIGVVRTHPLGPLALVALPIVLGLLMRGDSVSSLMDQIVFLAIFGPIAICALILGAQKIHLIPGGIEIKKLLRRSKSYEWSSISNVRYSRRLRYISLRFRGNLIYFNSTDGLQEADTFLIVAIYRVQGRCSQELQDELEHFFEIMERNEFEQSADSSPR